MRCTLLGLFLVCDWSIAIAQQTLSLHDAIQLAQQNSINAQLNNNNLSINVFNYTDLLLAQNQQLQARQGYVTAMAAYWQAYYQLRVTTLYDIVKQTSIYKEQ